MGRLVEMVAEACPLPSPFSAWTSKPRIVWPAGNVERDLHPWRIFRTKNDNRLVHCLRVRGMGNARPGPRARGSVASWTEREPPGPGLQGAEFVLLCRIILDV